MNDVMKMPAPEWTMDDLERLYPVALKGPSATAAEGAAVKMFNLSRTAMVMGLSGMDLSAFNGLSRLEQLRSLARMGEMSGPASPAAAIARFMREKEGGGTAPVVQTQPVHADPPAEAATTPVTTGSPPTATTAVATTVPAPSEPAKRGRRKGVEASPSEGETSGSAELEGKVYATTLRLLEDVDVLKKEMQARMNRLEAALSPSNEAAARDRAQQAEAMAELRGLMLFALEVLASLPPQVALSEARMRVGLPPV